MFDAFSQVEAKQGRPVEGLVEISGQDVFDLFDAGTNNKAARPQVHADAVGL